jgi:hypothetical protein
VRRPAPLRIGEGRKTKGKVSIPTRSRERRIGVSGFAGLEKNCKNLGIDIDLIKKTLEESSIALYPNLKKLVDTRNKIAHDETFEEVKSDDWEYMKGFVFVLMSTLQLHLYEFLNNKSKIFNGVV